MTKSILIIENEPFIIEALAYLLEQEGFRVSSHQDGKYAISQIKTINPDLLILDMMLPNISGLEILEELRQIEKFKSLPVLVLTARGQKKDRQAAEDAGASMFMAKPFSNKAIIENVNKLIN